MPCRQVGLENYRLFLKRGKRAVALTERCGKGGLIREANEIHAAASEAAGHRLDLLGAAS